MNEGLIHSLVIAKSLMDQASRQIKTGDRYQATTGLMSLQDGVEIVFVALLIDEGSSEAAKKALERKSFDQLMGDLSAIGINVPKSGTLSLLNKQRVQAKHYGLIVDTVSANQYLRAAEVAIDKILREKIGRGIREVLLQDLLQDGETKTFLISAEEHANRGDFRSSLIDIRKALFIEIEDDYNIAAYAPKTMNPRERFIWAPLTGLKSPLHTRNSDWIVQFVQTPVQYIQLNQDELRNDALRWGVAQNELENVFRLTPRVFRFQHDDSWYVEASTYIDFKEEEARYCLDRTIHILRRVQEYKASNKPFSPPDPPELLVSLGAYIYPKATMFSQAIGTVQPGWTYIAYSEVSGFDGKEYFQVACRQDGTLFPMMWGFISKEAAALPIKPR